MENELRDKFYERENIRKEELVKALDMEPLFNWLREVTGLDLKFEVQRIADKNRDEYRIDFTSQNIVQHSGIMQLNFTELYIDTFGNSVSSSKPDYYDKEEIDYTKDYNLYYWVSIHFSYKHIGGGSNGTKLGSATCKNGEWEFSLLKDEK